MAAPSPGQGPPTPDGPAPPLAPKPGRHTLNVHTDPILGSSGFWSVKYHRWVMRGERGPSGARSGTYSSPAGAEGGGTAVSEPKTREQTLQEPLPPRTETWGGRLWTAAALPRLLPAPASPRGLLSSAGAPPFCWGSPLLHGHPRFCPGLPTCPTFTFPTRSTGRSPAPAGAAVCVRGRTGSFLPAGDAGVFPLFPRIRGEKWFKKNK